MKAVIYARYSSDNQREESIEGQIRECKAYAEKHGITVLNSYIDRAFSAKTDNRPEFQRMIKDSAKHLFDVVLIWKLDRFARNRYDSAHNKAILRKNGVKVVSATETIVEDSTGILLESLEAAEQELQAQILSEDLLRPWISEEKVRFWLYKFRDGDLQDPDHRQLLVDSFVDAIFLYDDKLVLTFNYKDGSKTVLLSEIESSDIVNDGLPKKTLQP